MAAEADVESELKVAVAVAGVVEAESPSCRVRDRKQPRGRHIHDNAFISTVRMNTDNPSGSSEATRFGLIVLNGRPGPLLDHLWASAAVRVCADGGCNRLYDSLSESTRADRVPLAVVGDLDSARAEVLQFYRSKGCAVVPVAEQDTNDLEKCLRFLGFITKDADSEPDAVYEELFAPAAQHLRASIPPLDVVVAYGGLAGRLDQTLGTFAVLYRFSRSPLFPRLIAVSDDNTAELLVAGQHVLRPSLLEGPTCGLVPLGCECRSVTTTGLRWNLGGQSMQYGGLVSTCNLLDAEEITVDCSDPLLWTTAITQRKHEE